MLHAHENDAAAEAARKAEAAVFLRDVVDEPDSDGALENANGRRGEAAPEVNECTSAEVQARIYAKSPAVSSGNALEPPPSNTIGLDNALWPARVHDLPMLDAYEKDGSLHPGRSFDQRTTDPET